MTNFFMGGFDKMTTSAYNPGSILRKDAEQRGLIPSESAVDVQVAVVQAVPQPPRQAHRPLDRQARRAADRSFRRQFGTFVARETGTKYQAACHDYEPKSREKAPDRRTPLDDATVTRERANLRHDLAANTPERSVTLEGIYRWLEVYGSLTPEQRAERTAAADSESVQRLTVRVAGSKGGE